MSIKKRWLIPVIMIAALAVVYLYPTPQKAVGELYAEVDVQTVNSLTAFREANPVQTLNVGGVEWDYLVLGEGYETILFLHGMTGAYDIWWQQMDVLRDQYRVISVTYPAVDSLEELEQGVMAILRAEGVENFYLVGSSLGGYFAQYLVARHPHTVLGAVFANTFPPNEIIAENNKTIGVLLPYLPEWVVMNVLGRSIEQSVYAESGYSELVKAFGLEQTYGGMSKAQVLGRFRCVVEPFEAPDIAVLGISVLIIEAGNDPLVENALRDQLKETYPNAEVITLNNGHFPYLNIPEEYTTYLDTFFGSILLR